MWIFFLLLSTYLKTIYIFAENQALTTMARPIKVKGKGDSRALIQSYILTTAKYDFSAYEKRIMYRMVEFAQDELKGVLIRDNMHKMQPTLFGREIIMPVKDILKDEEDKHYTNAKQAFRSLSLKQIEYEDDEIWQSTPIITAPKIKKREGSVRFYVFNEVWEAMLDFTKGFRKYELLTAMKFKSVYSMRLYELMSGQENPIQFSYEELRERFAVADKYSDVRDFKKRVLNVAKKELDATSPYSFDYTDVKNGKNIVAFLFFPKHILQNENPEQYVKELNSLVSAKAILDNEIWNYLLHSLNFTNEEVNKNKQTFIEGQRTIPDFLVFLADLRGNARTARNPKGYIINAVRKKTAELSGEQPENQEQPKQSIDDIARGLANKFNINK